MPNNTLEMRAMTLDQVRTEAPQAFAATAKPGLSQKYSFLPTSRIIEDMDSLGWKVCQAKANKYRNTVNQEYGNHVIKFFHPDVYIRDTEGNIESYINVVVMNNHTGMGSFKFEMGIFRLVCSNGMIIKDTDMGSFNIRHKGYTFEQLQETLNQALTRLPDVVGKINDYNAITLTREQQLDFAKKALALRSYSDRVPTEAELNEFLLPRRPQDQGDSLWVILNRVQESVMKGGYHLLNARNKYRRAKSIKNIQKDIQLNQQIWELSAEYVS